MSDEIIPERIDYGDRELNREALDDRPMMVFRDWMEEAVGAGIEEANAACLCTVDGSGHPDGRTILIKGVEEDGLLFYTNYQSRKGRQLQECPRATLVLWWQSLRRQIRVSGLVKKLEAEQSDQYFSSRPPESRLGAWASLQSTPIANREVLETRLSEFENRFSGEIPRPDYWGGYRLKPTRFEFWQGRDSRLHDRFEYARGADGEWSINRLMP
ncbi:MAG: pyridoxamine 5'-phosphate oxidase [Candidatus Eremiobacteraeota bacterium]|nr:pyridoxamine 5'-phosphate oxidase [Candidatus Eremiobacteraeota bacterium]